jgi:hypothetical protein
VLNNSSAWTTVNGRVACEEGPRRHSRDAHGDHVALPPVNATIRLSTFGNHVESAPGALYRLKVDSKSLVNPKALILPYLLRGEGLGAHKFIQRQTLAIIGLKGRAL